MIGRLTGTITETQTNPIILDVQGVGYLINCPHRDLTKLQNNDTTTLHIHTHVKETNLDLFGFLDKHDLTIFKNLITVSGVGPKLALTILSQHTAEEIKSAISRADTSFFQAISGIGKKNAQKIIVELKSKFGSLKELDLSETDHQKHSDLIEALKSLGYTSREIKPLLSQIPNDVTKLEEQIKYILKELR